MKNAVRTTSAALAAVATAGVSTLIFGAAPASAADLEACGDGTLVGPGICEQTFTSGADTFTRTANMTQLEVLLVGAGGDGADQTAPNTNGYAAAGGGGEVVIVDFSSSTGDVDYTVATAGTSGTADDGAVSGTADNGLSASNGTETGGASGSGNPGASGVSNSTTPYGAGGGAGAVPANNADGGAGVVVSDIAVPGSLFATDDNCYGGGGAVGVANDPDITTVQGIPGCGAGGPDATSTALFAPVANSGGGGGGLNISQSPELRKGADGVVVFRWTANNITLSFDASGHGAAPAAQTVVPGTAPVKPADPTASGYTFKGWFTDAALTLPADFSAPLTESTTFYASWGPALAATGSTQDLTALPIGLAVLLAGAGLAGVASRRKRA